MIQPYSILLAAMLAVSPVSAQTFSMVGANRSDVSWHEFQTEHFRIIYHDGLENIARKAADVAEAIYPVVTGNLAHIPPGPTPIYLSDLDAVPNAFASSDQYVWIYMRGILDDLGLGGIRSAGRSKWLRAVITHEFTHTVIASATRTFRTTFVPTSAVPRWFNEGVARFMEPDGWTTDVDQVLRVAAVNGRLDYNGTGRLDGTLLYETGHSIVRYMTWRFGDSTIARIINAPRSALGGYSFERGVLMATGMSMSDIYRDWIRTVTVLYGTVYGQREETYDIARPITRVGTVIDAIRVSPDGQWMVVMRSDRPTDPALLLLSVHDSTLPAVVLSNESGFDREFSFNPNGSRIVLSKSRRGEHGAYLTDLFVLEIPSGDIERLTTDARLSDPAWSPDGTTILAVQKQIGRDRLVGVDPSSGTITSIYDPEGDVQMYTPVWSPDGSRIAFSIFDASGIRVVATIARDGSDMRRLVADSANNRYPVFSPDGSRIAFTSHVSGIPNLYVMNADGSARRQFTDIASGIYSVQWFPGSDSVIAIAFETRDHILPYAVPVARHVTPATTPDLRNRYTDWRTVSLPIRIPEPAAITSTQIIDSGDYTSITAINYQALVPLYATDRSASTGTTGARGGLASIWSDPMDIHTIIAAADFGFTSKVPGFYLYYENNFLPFTLAFTAERTLAFRRVIRDIPYYERRTGGSVGAIFNLIPDDYFTPITTLSLGLGYRRSEPWNAPEFAATDVVPQQGELLEISAGVTHKGESIFLSGSFTHGVSGLGTPFGYDQLQMDGSWRLGQNRGPALLLRLGGDARWGGGLPQEYIGLDPYDILEGGFSPLSAAPRLRVRGNREFVAGDRVVVTSAELLSPFISFPFGADTELGLFAEFGHAWFASVGSGNAPITSGWGVELRAPFAFGDITLTGGIAFAFTEHPRRDLYVRLVKGF